MYLDPLEDEQCARTWLHPISWKIKPLRCNSEKGISTARFSCGHKRVKISTVSKKEIVYYLWKAIHSSFKAKNGQKLVRSRILWWFFRTIILYAFKAESAVQGCYLWPLSETIIRRDTYHINFTYLSRYFRMVYAAVNQNSVSPRSHIFYISISVKSKRHIH